MGEVKDLFRRKSVIILAAVLLFIIFSFMVSYFSEEEPGEGLYSLFGKRDIEEGFEKMKAAYTYAPYMSEGDIDELISHGINTLIIKNGYENYVNYSSLENGIPESVKNYSKLAKQKNIMFFQALNFVHYQFRDKYGNPVDNSFVTDNYNVYSNGDQSGHASAWDPLYWNHLTELVVNLANFSKNYPDEYRIDGVWFDFELYNNYEDISFRRTWGFEDPTFNKFIADTGYSTGPIDGTPAPTGSDQRDDRFSWLENNELLDDYYLFLENYIYELAKGLREKIKQVNPDFMIGSYYSPPPYTKNSYIGSVYQGFSNETQPMILFATEMFSFGGASEIPENLSKQIMPGGYYNFSGIYDKGFYGYYIGGMVNYRYFVNNWAYHLYNVARNSNGYWIWTTWCFTEDFHILKEKSYDHILCYNSSANQMVSCQSEKEYEHAVDSYYQQMDIADEEINKLIANPDYETHLTELSEPHRFRDPESVGEFDWLYPLEEHKGEILLGDNNLELRTQHNFIFRAEKDEIVEIEISSKAIGKLHLFDGLNYIITDLDGKRVKKDFIDINNKDIISFTSPKTTLYALMVNPALNAFSITKTSVPIMVYEKGEIKSIHFRGNLSFWVDTNDFSVHFKAEGGREGANATIYKPTPTGYEKVASGGTNEFIYSFVLEVDVPPEAKNKIWKVEISEPDPFPSCDGVPNPSLCNPILEDVEITFNNIDPYFGLTDNEGYFMTTIEKYPSFFLDVGTLGDDNPSNIAFLKVVNGVSGPLTENSVTYRTLDSNKHTYFYINTSLLYLDENGVPYRDAILQIRYKDVVDELNCVSVDYARSYCRPYLLVKLDWGGLGDHKLNGIAGLNDNNWKTQTIFLENTPWQTLRSVDGYFVFDLYYPNQLNWWEPLPIDYVNLTFVNKSEFNRIRELDRKNRYFTRKDYIETNTIDPADYTGNYILYSRNYLERIYPNTIPNSSEILNIGDKLETFEIVENYEPLSFAIYAFEDLENVEIEISDLQKGNEMIEKDNIKIEKVVNADKRWRYGHDGYYGTNPWYLDGFDSLNIKKDTTQQIWLTIYVPDVPEGVYTGKIKVFGDSIKNSEIPVELEVISLKLEKPDSEPILYSSPFNSYLHYSDPDEIAANNMFVHDAPPLYPTFSMEINTNDFSYNASNEFNLKRYQKTKEAGLLSEKVRMVIWSNYDRVWNKICGNLNYLIDECENFDNNYTHAFRELKKFFDERGIEPIVSFNDEPGEDPVRRKQANHMNKLAKQVGLKTWVTYHPQCEKPLSGHELNFIEDIQYLFPDTTNPLPDWVLQDSALLGLWNFEGGLTDKSGNGNNGFFEGDAHLTIENGNEILVLDGWEDCVNLGSTLAKSSSYGGRYGDSSISVWVKPIDNGAVNVVTHHLGGFDYLNTGTPSPKGRIRAMVKDRVNNANYWPESNSIVNSNGWAHVVFVLESGKGYKFYINGKLDKEFNNSNLSMYDYGSLAFIGMGWDEYSYFKGSVDELIVFKRDLSEQEIKEIYESSYISPPTRERYINLSLVVDRADIPNTINFSIDNRVDFLPGFETLKNLSINGKEAWSLFKIEEKYPVYSIDISPYLVEEENKIEFIVSSYFLTPESLQIYFVEDFWRNANWEATTNANNWWSSVYTSDINGNLGPMDLYLDERVYSRNYVTEEEIEKTKKAGDVFSWYTTYPATQPVVLNNRFLNGIYASAIEAEGTFVYAYGDWGNQPYDDMENGPHYRIGNTNGLRGQNVYALALPSWDSKMHDTIMFESLREGIEDSKIIATLKKAIAEHPGARANEAQAYLNGLFLRLSKDYPARYIKTNYNAPIEKYADISEEILTDLAGDLENYDFFDETRRTMIGYVIELNSQSGDDDDDDSGDDSGDDDYQPLRPYFPNLTDYTNQTTPTNQTNQTEHPLPEDKKQYWVYGFICFLLVMILSTIILMAHQINIKHRAEVKTQMEQKQKEKIMNAKDLISEMKRRGHGDSFIKRLFVDKGWDPELIDKLSTL